MILYGAFHIGSIKLLRIVLGNANQSFSGGDQHLIFYIVAHIKHTEFVDAVLEKDMIGRINPTLTTATVFFCLEHTPWQTQHKPH